MDQFPMQYAWDQVNLGSGFYKRKEYIPMWRNCLGTKQLMDSLAITHTVLHCCMTLMTWPPPGIPCLYVADIQAWFRHCQCSLCRPLLISRAKNQRVTTTTIVSNTIRFRPDWILHNPVQTGLNLAESSLGRIEPCAIRFRPVWTLHNLTNDLASVVIACERVL